MKQNTLIEIGSITCNKGLCFTVYAEHITFTGRGEDTDVTVEGIELEREDGKGNVLESIIANSLAEMPDRFSERQVTALYLHILEEHRISQQAYEQDIYVNAQRGHE